MRSVGTSNHIFGRAIWDELPECKFSKFLNITRVLCTVITEIKFKIPKCNNSGNRQFWKESYCNNNTINTDFGYLNLTEL